MISNSPYMLFKKIFIYTYYTSSGVVFTYQKKKLISNKKSGYAHNSKPGSMLHQMLCPHLIKHKTGLAKRSAYPLNKYIPHQQNAMLTATVLPDSYR